ncbi:sulfurtransferase FdhD [Paucibacter sp. KBW04]|uniref:formate dehydrogenase accessory sulfurtransferase FdhD n=1 Tax=Paucibacter sp. KBW04 TaxID=2153361 RepID=UPI000F57FFC9|nr:formate dehydrogenase accessory sulfurtransferase FdhD [Paucibacter sp. KBW04]RQO63248.1 sulfurtransferase FdhD [Paucibacter sp. KBW04]
MPHQPSPHKPGLPRLSQAQVGLTREIEVQDEQGLRRRLHIPCERPLTVFVDKRELITLMTLGVAPELLVLGYLRNQGLIHAAEAIESITVDWEVGAAALRTHAGLSEAWAQKTAKRTLTTGCGQGTVFGDMMAGLEGLALPAPTQARLSKSALYAQLVQMRAQDSVYKQAGSVHGCALFEGERLLVMVEDVGRHNALDTIAGWLWMNHPGRLQAPVLYTTGRMTSEMVLKAAWMGVPIIVSRNGITQMGFDLAQQLGLCLIGRAKGRHFIVYSGFERFDAML